MRFKKIRYFFVLLFFTLLLLFAFFYIFCVHSYNDDQAYVELEGSVKICNNNPSSSAIPELLEGLDREGLTTLIEKDDPCGFLLYGVLSKDGAQSYGVEKNLENMVLYIENAWRHGSVDAGYRLFAIYYEGIGVSKNKELALNYLLESASMGYIKSQRQLGVAYRGLALRDLVDKNESASFKWFLAAAQQGDKLSATNVAAFFHAGKVVDRNDVEAFQWFAKAENMPYGVATSGFRGLAAYYENGIGTDVNLVQAYKYYDLLSPGSAPDKARLAEQMTPEQIHEAISLSRQWQEEHNIFVPSYYGLEYQEDGTFQ